MADYLCPPAPVGSFVTLDPPAKDAWLQPVNGAVYVTDAASPSKARAGIIQSLVPYPVSAGSAVKVASAEPFAVPLRMWDRS